MMLMNTDVVEPPVEKNSKWRTGSFMLWRQKQPRLMAQIRGGIQSMQMFMCVYMCVCILVLKCVWAGGRGSDAKIYWGEERKENPMLKDWFKCPLPFQCLWESSWAILFKSSSTIILPFFKIFNLLCLSLFHLLLLYIYYFLVYLLIVSPPIEYELHEDRDGVVLTALHHHLSRGWYVAKSHHVLLEWVDNRWAFKET